MIKSLFLFAALISANLLLSQQALPENLLRTLRDSTTSIDIVFLKGQEGSITADGPNVRVFSSFVENKTTQKTSTSPSGNIMWLINGREFISGSYFLTDSSGYFVLVKDGSEYVNKMSAQGGNIFKTQFKN